MLKLLLPSSVCFCKGRGDATATRSHIFTQIGQEKQVLSCLFFFETLDPIRMSFFFIPTTENAPFPALAECIWGSAVSPF